MDEKTGILESVTPGSQPIFRISLTILRILWTVSFKCFENALKMFQKCPKRLLNNLFCVNSPSQFLGKNLMIHDSIIRFFSITDAGNTNFLIRQENCIIRFIASS